MERDRRRADGRRDAKKLPSATSFIYSTKQMEIPSAFNCELGATFIFIVTFGSC